MHLVSGYQSAATDVALETRTSDHAGQPAEMLKPAEREQLRPPARGRAALATFTLLLVVTLVLVVTMPRMIYSGDPVATRQATIHWLNDGDISVTPEVAGVFGEKGKYYFEHPTTGKLYPKYGILNTFVYAPPLWCERLLTGELKYSTELNDAELLRRCRILNIYNIIVCLFVAYYLIRITRLHCRTAWSSVIYVAFVFFGTFLWNYSRAQTGELFQVLFFVAVYYHLVCYRRECMRETNDAKTAASVRRACWKHSSLAVAFVGLMVLQKLVFAVLLPIVISFIAFGSFHRKAGETAGRSVLDYLQAILQKGRRRWAVVSVAGLVVVSTIVLSANSYRFGSAFATGYGQWERERDFLSGNPAEGLAGYLINPQKSVFLYFPVLALALAGMKEFYRRSAYAFSFALLSFLAVYVVSSMFVNWSGNWCYGPRYLLFVLPVLALPMLKVLDWAILRRHRLLARLTFVAIGVVFLWSASRQWYVNRLDYFLPFHVAEEFRELEDPAIQSYLRKPFWTINRDLLAYHAGQRSFPVLERSRSRLSADQFHLKAQRLSQMIVGNMYFLDVRPFNHDLPDSGERMAASPGENESSNQTRTQ